VVGHAEADAIAIAARCDHHIGRHAVRFRRMMAGVFDGIVDEIGERLSHQLAIAAHRQGAPVSILSVRPFSSASGS